MKKNYLKTFIATLLMAVGSVCVQAAPLNENTTIDIEDESTYSKKTFDFANWTSSTTLVIGSEQCGTAYETGNAIQQKIYKCTAPEELAGIFAFQGVSQGSSKGTWLRGSGYGILNFGAARSAAILNLKAGQVVVFNGNTETDFTGGGTDNGTWITSISGDNIYVTMTKDGNLGFCLKYQKGSNFYTKSITIYTPIVAGVCENPEYKITGAVGTKRTFTLSCLTEGATIYYSDTELTADDEGWTEYTGEVTTEAETIYAYAKTSDATSEVINFATGAGTSIKLNAPTFSKTAYANGKYTVSFYADQSSLSPAPAAFSYAYSIDGGEEQTGNSVQVPAGSSVSVYTKADGYDNSDVVEAKTTARPTDLAEVWSQDYTKLTSADGTGAMQVILNETADFTVGETDFFNIIGYVSGTDNRDITVTPNVGLNTSTNFHLRDKGDNSGILKNGTPAGYIGINNLKPGDVIIITTSSNPLEANAGVTLEEGMSLTNEYYFTATNTAASIYFPHGTYNYVKTIAVKRPQVSVSLPYEYNTYCTQSALDFTGNEDVEAYTAEMNGEGTAVTLTQVYQVPEGAGVILKRKGEATTANVNIITSADELSGNQLKGVKTPMQAAELVAENAYILVDQLFCRVTESSEGELAAGKAYLAVPANVKAAATLSLGFGNITGATEVEAQAKATAGEIYNMQGMRVKSATKGIYIIGGKKYCF